MVRIDVPKTTILLLFLKIKYQQMLPLFYRLPYGRQIFKLNNLNCLFYSVTFKNGIFNP